MGGLCSKDNEKDDAKHQKKKSRYAAAQQKEDDVEVKPRDSGAADLPPTAPAAKTSSVKNNNGGALSHPDPSVCRPDLVDESFLQFKNAVQHGEQATCVARAHTGNAQQHKYGKQTIIIGGEDASLHIIDTENGNVVKSWKKAHKKDINRVTTPHHETNLFLTCGRDNLVKAWNANGEDDEAKAVFEGHTLNVTTVTHNPEGTLMVSGSRDNSVRMWDIETERCLSTQDVKLNIVHFCRWIPALQMVAQGGEDLTVRLWDTREKDGSQLTLEDTLANFDYHPICSALVGPQAASVSLYTGHNGFNGQGAMITEWDLRMRKQVRHFQGHRGTVRWVKEITHGSGGKLVSCSDDGTIRLWNLNDGSLDAEVSIPEGVPTCCDELEDGTLAFACRTGVVVCAKVSEFGDNLVRTRYVGKGGELY